MIFSIDQNSHSLWDTLPKLHALQNAGHTVTHYVEDIDLAFTDIGNHDPRNTGLRNEQYYASGGTDWGASLFYHRFLGKQPVGLRHLEPQFGLKVSAAAKKLGIPLDSFYERYSTSDNIMLVGSSYIDSCHHRTLGDLSMAETAPYLHEIIDIAEADLMGTLPGNDSQSRLSHWFETEREKVSQIIASDNIDSLPKLYCSWLQQCTSGSITYDLSSSLFTTHIYSDAISILEIFTRNYRKASSLYNQAIEETGQEIHRLDTSCGQLPFHAILEFNGHHCRIDLYIEGDRLIVADKSFQLGPGGSLPLKALYTAGITALTGKAIVLVLQAMAGGNGAPPGITISRFILHASCT